MSACRKALLLLMAAALPGSPTPSSAAPSAGVETRIDSLFGDLGGSAPGCAVGVFRAGEIVFSKGYGLADLESKAPITPRTVFDVASLSKQFTAFAIALLAREGRISLDDEVQKHVPELPRLGLPITIRHLVHHTSGLREYGALMELAGWRLDEPLSKADALALLKRQRGLNFKTGERHEYNNTNYFLMGLIVERASGRPFQEYASEKIFRPLGMTSTRVRYPTDPIPERAVNYTGRRDGSYVPNRVWDRAYGAGVANVHTNIEDLAKWDRNFFSPTVGDRSLIDQLYSPGTLNSGEATAYAFGLDVGTHRGRRAISHGGMGGGSFHLLRLPEERLSVATLCNRYSLGAGAVDTWTLSRKVADVFLSPDEPSAPKAQSSPAPAVALSAAELSKFVGSYWQASGPPLRIAVENGQLVEVYAGKGDPIFPIGRGEFRNSDGTATYTFSGPGNRALTYHERPTDYTARGERRPQWSPTGAELKRAAGRYCNAEVPVCWTLFAVGDKLLLRRPAFRDASLQPAYSGTFWLVDADDIGTRFTRIDLNGAGERRPLSFSVFRGRVSDILFERTNDRPSP